MNWHKITDRRKPQDDELVLTCDKYGHVELAWYNARYDTYASRTSAYRVLFPEYWTKINRPITNPKNEEL